MSACSTRSPASMASSRASELMGPTDHGRDLRNDAQCHSRYHSQAEARVLQAGNYALHTTAPGNALTLAQICSAGEHVSFGMTEHPRIHQPCAFSCASGQAQMPCTCRGRVRRGVTPALGHRADGVDRVQRRVGEQHRPPHERAARAAHARPDGVLRRERRQRAVQARDHHHRHRRRRRGRLRAGQVPCKRAGGLSSHRSASAAAGHAGLLWEATMRAEVRRGVGQASMRLGMSSCVRQHSKTAASCRVRPSRSLQAPQRWTMKLLDWSCGKQG